MKKILYIFLVVLIFSSCEKGPLSIFSKKDRLTQNNWQIKTFINNSTNTVFDAGNLKYRFEENGTYVVIAEDQREYTSSWEFIDNGNYIRIANSTFKVKVISDRLLGLRIGETEIFYTPVD